jgi:hypothetical protein
MLPVEHTMRRQTARQHHESGQVTAMLVILTLALLLAVAAVADVSAAYLRGQSTMSLADGAALAATDAAAAASVYGHRSDRYVAIDPTAAAAAVDRYLRATGAYRHFPGLSFQVAVDGHTLRVSLAAPYRLPVPVPGAVSTTTVHGDGAAVMPIY